MINLDYSDIRSLPELLSILHNNNVSSEKFWMYVELYINNKTRESGIPLYGQFELTPLCNLDCKMCYVHLKKEQLKGERLLSVEQWEDVINQAHSMGMRKATLTGGECLTYSGFDKLYLYLRSLGVSIDIKTNGVLLNQDRIDFFSKYPPENITISIYGSSNSAYEEVTEHAVFDDVYNNIFRVKNANLPMNLAITPSRYMLNDIENLLEVVEKIQVKCFLNVVLFPPRKETGRKTYDISAPQYAEILKKMKKKDSSGFISIEESELPECGNNRKSIFGIQCGAGRNSFSVSWNGLMTSCDNLDSLKVSLLETSFSDAWNQIHQDAISYPLPMECYECAYDKVCFSCVAYRGIQAERGHCNPKICERTKLFVKEGIYNL